ncbi:MAG: phosphoribosylanthranilate isomerase [Balneolaceae bacterium]|nr:phosphoribosylanthranilate isomerase [Balneolaceae bacterium]
MTSPALKICGITRLEDARFCAGAFVDRLGFIFTEQSQRTVDVNLVGAITQWIEGMGMVAVTMDQPLDDVKAILKRSGCSHIQLHGDEPPHYCEALDVPIIKTISVGPEDTAQEVQSQLDRYNDVVDEFLFDSRLEQGGQTQRGGTGQPFDWSILHSCSIDKPYWIGGGLDATRIQEALELYTPYGFDVNSGVEEAPGIKDYDKISHLTSSLKTTS